MLAEERQMIESLSERLREAQPNIQKDKEAAALIEEKIAGQKDVVYQLTQAALLQEHALGQAQQQITQLRAELEQQRQQATQKPGGSFLGNLFGGNKNQQPPSSHAQNFAGGQQQFAGTPGQYHSGPQQGGFMGAAPQQGAGSSFLRNAAAGAVGVAGGMLLFEGLSNMFGSSAHAAAPSEVINETVINEAPAESADASQTGFDQGAMDTGGFDQGTLDNNSLGDFGGSDFSGGFGGDDFGGGDFGGGDW